MNLPDRVTGGRSGRPPTGAGGALALTILTTLALAGLPSPARGQPVEGRQDVATLQQRVEELEAALEALRAEHAARLDSLEARLAEILAERGAAGAAAGAEAGPEEVDAEERAELERELAALLGEGGEAAGGAEAPPREPQAGGQRFTSRTRNLNQLNPEISVAGDVVGVVADRTGDPEVNQFRYDEFEVAFQSTLDPYSMAKAFIVQEGGEVEVEEAYIDYTSLPGGLGLKIGEFRHDWGKLNRWHTHGLPQTDRPLVHQAVWGEGGLKGLGVAVSWLPPTFLGDYNEVTVQVTNDQNDAAFTGRGFDDPVFLVHETNYLDLSPASYIEVGLSAATGVNDPSGEFRTWVYGVDWNYSWQPPERSLYQGFELRGELLWESRDGEAGSEGSLGAYTYGTWKLDRRWSVGLRGDWTELPLEPGESVWGVSPYVEWWQSEWAKLRFQYSHASRQLDAAEVDNRFIFQIVWALGPHKHEKY